MSKKHILVVTADSQLGNLLTGTILRPANYEVSYAPDMQTAEAYFRSLPPDLIVLDAAIEDGKGWDFAAELLTHFPILPIVFCVAAGQRAIVESALELGVVDFIFHPWEDASVLRVIGRGLRRRAHFEHWLNRRSRESTDTLRHRLNVLETLQQVGRAVTASLDLDHVLTQVVESAVNMTGAEEGSLLILDEQSGELYMRAARNFQDDFVRTFRLPVNDSLAGEVARTGRPIILNEETPKKIKTAYLVRTLLYVPLKIQERVIGVLGVDNRTRSQPFLEQHLTLVAALADYAAIAIENARLFQNTTLERHKLAAILGNIGDGVIVADENRRLILINQAAALAFGIPETDSIQQPVEQSIHHEQLLELFTLEPHTSPYNSEITLEGGRVFNAQLVKIPKVGRVITLQEITHFKELDRIKSDFVHNVSHDLRSPLTAILGYVELIGRVGPVNEQQAEFIERVQISVRNITNLIGDLLELGRIESGFDSRKERTPLSLIVRYSIESLESNSIKKEQRLTLDISEEATQVFGDPTRLRQLVDNLLSNAIRYTPWGGLIRVSLRAEIDQVILQISDTGPGIPPADQPYIFDKFYRGSNIDPDIPGSGLGLAIVKTIVENHQGRVWVDSTLGQGSTFTVVLPKAA